MNVLLLLPFLFLSYTSLAASNWKSTIGADLSIDEMHNFNSLGPDTKLNRTLGTLKIPTSVKYGRNWRLRLLPNLAADPINVTKKERYFWDAQEAYLQYQKLPLTVQAGFNVVQWGDTDVFNPLDVVNRRRLWDPFRSEKLGSAMLLLKRDFEKVLIEGIYIPKQRHALIPGDNSRWLPREIYRDRNIVSAIGTSRIQIPSNLNYYYVEPNEMDQALSNNFGLRMKFRFSGLDATLIGYQGAAAIPAVNIRTISGALVGVNSAGNEQTFLVDKNIGLRMTDYKTRVGGLSFAKVLGDFLLKGAYAYTSPVSKDSGIPLAYQEGTLGLERTLGFGDHTITAIAQGTYVKRKEGMDASSVSLGRMFDRGGMTAIRWTIGERWTILGSYLRDFYYKGNLGHGEISFKLKDAMFLKATGDALAGKLETPLGTFKKNNRVTLGISIQV